MSYNELRERQNQLREDSRLSVHARLNAKKAWKEAGEKGQYPAHLLQRPRIIKTSAYKSRSAANGAIDKMEESKRASAEREAEKLAEAKKALSYYKGGLAKARVDDAAMRERMKQKSNTNGL